tara:strand:+ start:1256 stop:2194 length:939 start_codon:yes stop_codon:yes gene_type:complete
MIIGFETGKSFNDRIVHGFVNKIDGTTYQTYTRKHVQKQYDDMNIVHKNPLPKDVDHVWQALDEYDNPKLQTSAYAFWGFLRSTKKIYQAAVKRKVPFYFFDQAYFYHKIHAHKKSSNELIRNPYIRVCKNSFNKETIDDVRETGLFKLKRQGTEDFTLHPWKKKGKKVYIIPPSFHMCEFLGLKHADVLKDMVDQVKANTDREVVIRYKKPNGEYNPRPVEVDAQDAWAVVSFQSNAVIKFLMHGVPSFTYLPKHSVAVPLSLQDLTKIDTPFYPDNRYEWLCNLCNNQFQEGDVYNGKVLDYLNRDKKKW